MNYGQLIADAFWISWRNRFLWIFGFLLGGISSVFGLSQNAVNLFGGQETRLEEGRFVFENFGLFVALLVVLVPVQVFLLTFSLGALIDGVAALHRGEERDFSSAFRAGLSNFWRVLGFLILVFVVYFVLAVLAILLIGLPVVFAFLWTTSFVARFAVVVLVVSLLVGVFFLISIPLSAISMLGSQALVLYRENVLGSFESGYDLLVRRFGRVLLVFIISFALSLGTSVVLLILASLLGLLLAVPALLLFAADLSTAGTVVGVVAGVVFVVIYLVVASALSVFYYAYWTLAYLQLTSIEGEAGIEHR